MRPTINAIPCAVFLSLLVAIAGCGGNAGSVRVPPDAAQSNDGTPTGAAAAVRQVDNNSCPRDVLYTSFDIGERVFAPDLYGYALSSSGDSKPCMVVSTIEQTRIGGYAYETHGLAVSIHGSIHAANFIPAAGVQVFNDTANATNGPFRTIATPGINFVFNLALDDATNDYLSSQYGLYSGSDSSCYVWADRNAATFGAPSREVCNDGFTPAQPIYAMAAQGANLVLVTNGRIDVLAHPASSDPSVKAVISGARTQLSETNSGEYPTWYSAAVDPVDGTIYVATTNGTSSAILAFAATANGDVPPLRILDVPYFVSGPALAVDAAHQLYVSLGPLVGYTDVEVFAPGAAGNAAPARTIVDRNGDGWAIAVTGLRPPAP